MNRTAQQTITIFGGTGFVGRALVRHLAKSGALIRIPTRNPDKALRLKPCGRVGQIVPIACSLKDKASLQAAIAGSDIVINLVGILYEKGGSGFERLHAALPAQLGEIAAKAGVKQFVHLSAIGAKKESESTYARSKAAGEMGLRKAFPAATILRPSIIFGPDDGFFNLFAEMALFLPALPLIGGGHTKFQPVYVEDVAAAIAAVLKQEQAAGKTYELGGPQIYSFKELLVMMLAEIGRPRLLLPLPYPLAMVQAALLSLLPKPLLTQDQVRLLKQDNVVTEGAQSLANLGISPTALELILPTYMDRYRSGGRFSKRKSRDVNKSLTEPLQDKGGI